MLTPPAGAPADFPAGEFTEYDLDDCGDELMPVDRPYGRNVAGIVVGVISNYTPLVPEGMRRVAILGDPTSGLGNLAEPECRRVLAALALARRLGVPVEWFALSSGARIAWDSGTENMDWIAAVLRRLIEFTQSGGEVNVVVTGINVGAQPYWNAEATMLMHTRGILVMTPASAMVLTGKSSLDYSGGVSAEDNFGIGGFDRIMGPNGQGQYWAPTLADACALLLRHYEHTYIVPGEDCPRRAPTSDPFDRDVCVSPHKAVAGSDFERVGDIFSAELNGERKKPFDMRSVMRAVTDADHEPFERWMRWRDGENAIVWEAHVGGIPGLPHRPRITDPAPYRIHPGRRPAVVDIRHALPAVLAQGRPRRERRQRQPPPGGPGQPQRVRRLTGEHAQMAAGVRRRDRPRGDQLPRPDRLRGRVPLPRRRLRGVLQATARRHGDCRGDRLLRIGDRRRAGRRGRLRARGQRQDRARSPRGVHGREARRGSGRRPRGPAA